MPTKADDWRARARQSAIDEAEDLALPSGITIRARRPDALQLATWGRLPLTLAALVSNSGAGPRPASDPDAPPEISDADALDAMAFVRDLLLTCCIDPRVTLTPQSDNEIHPRDIPQKDWVFLVAWAMRWTEASALKPFPIDRPGPGPGSHSQDVGHPTERPDWHPGPRPGPRLRSRHDDSDPRSD